MRRALTARVAERVGEDEPALRVGVDHLDRLAVHRSEDVAGPVRAAPCHVLGRGDHGEHAERDAQVGDRADALDHRRAARHVPLHVLHVVRCLERDPAGVEGDRLADQAEHEVVACAGRVVAQDDQPRVVVASLCHRRERAHAHLLDLSAVERLVGERARPLRDLGSTLGEPLRREVVRRAVREVAGAVRPLCDALGALRQLQGLVVRPDEDEPLRQVSPGPVGLPGAGVVAAEHEAVHDRARLLGRAQAAGSRRAATKPCRRGRGGRRRRPRRGSSRRRAGRGGRRRRRRSVRARRGGCRSRRPRPSSRPTRREPEAADRGRAPRRQGRGRRRR